MRAWVIFCRALVRRLAIVASGTRNIRAIAATSNPARVRSARATWAWRDRAGWQQVNTNRSRSSCTTLSGLAIPAAGSLTTMPANLTYIEAAPSTEGSHYALANIRGAKITAGQDVLVYGATGAIGSAAVQLLKSLGVNVTAVCDTANMDLVKKLGAARVIDYTTTDFTKDDQTYDVVLDSVGRTFFGQCRPLLKPAGIYISSELGPHAQNPFLALIAPLQRGKRVMFPIPKHDQEMMVYLRELMECGQFRPVIDRTYPLDRIVEAYRYVESGQKIGNVVITVDHSD
jgi:NADPH:quinone reductase-like Zn-dependent oxidoreductase